LISVACDAPGLVYPTEACAAPGHVYTLGPELHLDMSDPQGPVLLNVCTLRVRVISFASRVYFSLSLFFIDKQVRFALIDSQFSIKLLRFASRFTILKNEQIEHVCLALK
jgi:hypothetical protein